MSWWMWILGVVYAAMFAYGLRMVHEANKDTNR